MKINFQKILFLDFKRAVHVKPYMKVFLDDITLMVEL